MIVTENLQDFLPGRLAPPLKAMTADQFVLTLIDDDIDRVLEVVEDQAAGLANPPMTAAELLDGLAVVGLTKSVGRLKTALSNDS